MAIGVAQITVIETTVPYLLAISSVIGIVLCSLVLYLMFVKNVKGMFNIYIGNLIVTSFEQRNQPCHLFSFYLSDYSH